MNFKKFNSSAFSDRKEEKFPKFVYHGLYLSKNNIEILKKSLYKFETIPGLVTA